MSPVYARPADPTAIARQLRAELHAFARILRQDGHADHAEHAAALARKYGPKYDSTEEARDGD
ncbi:hypothetical protein ACIGO9_30185 [Nocardia asteroides]|uniref:hypothetical protein n=1 Tax=Nocardia asteroides TaxID=1824 RepID=UPI0037C81370